MEEIEIRRGDSSDFFYQIILNLQTEQDLTDWKGYLQIANLKPLPYTDISSKQIDIILSSEYTSLLRVGTYTAYLKLIKPSGVVGTLEPIFIIKVLPEVVNVK